MRICVFCGSSFGLRPEYTQAAQSLVKALVARKIGLVYGGATVGLMSLIADTMLTAGGEVIGVIPRSLKEREIAHTQLSALHIVEDMHQRKAKMAELSDGFIALPGGAGTLEELFEVWTWAKLSFHDKPCGFLNVEGYYDRLLEFLDHMVEEQFIKAQHRTMLCVAEQPADLLEQFSQYIPPTRTGSPLPAPPNIVDVIAWVCIENKRLLCARTKGNEVFYLPGGKRKPQESDWDGLCREVQEEVSVALIKETFTKVMTVEEIAHGYQQPTWVTMKCFQASYTGSLTPTSEIEEIAWLRYADKEQCAPATQRVIEYLRDRQLMD